MATSAELTHLSRIEATRELQRLSLLGFAEASRLLSLINVDNYVELWPIIAPLLDNIMRVEQQSGRSVLGTYLVATGVAAGVLSSTRAVPDLSFMDYRDGRLPSGMPWSRLIYGAPRTITTRIEMGMSPVQALNQSKFTLIGAINSQAHSEMRVGTKDVLDWATEKAKIEKRLAAAGFTQRTTGGVIVDGRVQYDTDRPKLQVVRDSEPFHLSDQDYRRYIRQPSPGACSWCLMQATRGAVFLPLIHI